MTEFSLFFGLFEHPLLVIILALMNWPLYRWLIGVVFGGVDGLAGAIKFWFVPDFYSFVKNQHFEDQWAELKLSAWFLLCALSVIAEYGAIVHFLEWWYENVVCCSPQAD